MTVYISQKILDHARIIMTSNGHIMIQFPDEHKAEFVRAAANPDVDLITLAVPDRGNNNDDDAGIVEQVSGVVESAAPPVGVPVAAASDTSVAAPVCSQRNGSYAHAVTKKILRTEPIYQSAVRNTKVFLCSGAFPNKDLVDVAVTIALFSRFLCHAYELLNAKWVTQKTIKDGLLNDIKKGIVPFPDCFIKPHQLEKHVFFFKLQENHSNFKFHAWTINDKLLSAAVEIVRYVLEQLRIDTSDPQLNKKLSLALSKYGTAGNHSINAIIDTVASSMCSSSGDSQGVDSHLHNKLHAKMSQTLRKQFEWIFVRPGQVANAVTYPFKYVQVQFDGRTELQQIKDGRDFSLTKEIDTVEHLFDDQALTYYALENRKQAQRMERLNQKMKNSSKKNKKAQKKNNW